MTNYLNLRNHEINYLLPNIKLKIFPGLELMWKSSTKGHTPKSFQLRIPQKEWVIAQQPIKKIEVLPVIVWFKGTSLWNAWIFHLIIRQFC